MEVRCERCKARYTFADGEVGPAGRTIRCTGCGHTFRVVKKELVVTLPVREPGPAAQPARPAPEPAPTEGRSWLLRRSGGPAIPLRELTTLQRWIVERRVGRNDEISSSGGSWRRLGEIAELAPFFDVVDAAGRADTPAGPPPSTPARQPPGAITPTPQPATAAGVPSFPSVAHGRDPAWAAQTVVAPPEPDLNVDVEVTGAVVAAARRGRRRAGLGAALVLLAAAGAAGYVALERGRTQVVAGPDPSSVSPDAPVVAAPPSGEAAGAVSPPATSAPPVGRSPGAAPAPQGSIARAPEPVAAPAEPATPPPPAGAPPAPAAPTPPPERAATSTPDAGVPDARAAPAEQPTTAREPETAPSAAAPTGAADPRAAQKSQRALLAQADRLRKRGEVAHALVLYARVVADDPRNVEALVGKGLSQLDLSQYAGAVASFEAALEADPQNPDAVLGLAETCRWQGEEAEAIRYYEQYLAQHPEGEEAAVARNAIVELRRGK
jgi:predicted Zn finger-like uncharacterized protein